MWAVCTKHFFWALLCRFFFFFHLPKVKNLWIPRADPLSKTWPSFYTRPHMQTRFPHWWWRTSRSQIRFFNVTGLPHFGAPGKTQCTRPPRTQLLFDKYYRSSGGRRPKDDVRAVVPKIDFLEHERGHLKIPVISTKGFWLHSFSSTILLSAELRKSNEWNLMFIVQCHIVWRQKSPKSHPKVPRSLSSQPLQKQSFCKGWSQERTIIANFCFYAMFTGVSRDV